MGLVRGRVSVDGRSLGDAPIPGVRSRSGDSGSFATNGDASTRVDSPAGDWQTSDDDAFDDWADESYVDDADTLTEEAFEDSNSGDYPAGVDSPEDESDQRASVPDSASEDADTPDAGHPATAAGEDTHENASDEPVAGKRAPFGTRVRSAASRAAMGRLGVFFNPVARFRELSAKDADGSAAPPQPRKGEGVASADEDAPLDDDGDNAREGDDEADSDTLVDDATLDDSLPDVELGDDSEALDGDLGDDAGEGDSEGAAAGGGKSARGRVSRRVSGFLSRTVRGVASLVRRVFGVLLWPLSFVWRFVSRLVARPLSFVGRLLSRVPVVGRLVRLVGGLPRRVRRLLRLVAWCAVVGGVLFACGWRPPFVPVSSGVAGVDLPDSGHLSVSAWRVDDELVNVHVVNDGETVVEGESVEVRTSAWVPLSRLPWSLVTRTGGESCPVDISVVDVEDEADFVVSCPAVGGIGESVAPVGSSFGE